MGPIGCPETSERNYHSTLRNIPEEGRSQLLRGGSLNSRTAGQVSVSANSLLKHFELPMKIFRFWWWKLHDDDYGGGGGGSDDDDD